LRTSPDANLQNIFLLLVTAALKFGLTAYTFGMKVRAGLFATLAQQSLYCLGPCWDILAYNCHWRILGSCHGFSRVRSVVYPPPTVADMNLAWCRQAFHLTYPHAWVFSACPPDVSAHCISPGFYAVIGASALLGGVTRMTSTYASQFVLTSFPHMSSLLGRDTL